MLEYILSLVYTDALLNIIQSYIFNTNQTATLKCISLHKDQPRRAVDSFYKIGQYVQSSCLPTKGTKFILSPLIITLGLSQIPVLYLQRDITLLCITLSQIPTV